MTVIFLNLFLIANANASKKYYLTVYLYLKASPSKCYKTI